MMESFTGLFSTLILVVGIGFLTVQGFRREVANIKKGTCCSSVNCSCGANCGNCGSKCSGEYCHEGDLK